MLSDSGDPGATTANAEMGPAVDAIQTNAIWDIGASPFRVRQKSSSGGVDPIDIQTELDVASALLSLEVTGTASGRNGTAVLGQPRFVATL